MTTDDIDVTIMMMATATTTRTKVRVVFLPSFALARAARFCSNEPSPHRPILGHLRISAPVSRLLDDSQGPGVRRVMVLETMFTTSPGGGTLGGERQEGGSTSVCPARAAVMVTVMGVGVTDNHDKMGDVRH
jgi:hypothetical protein